MADNGNMLTMDIKINSCLSNQIVPYMGKLIVSNITGADIKRLISTLTDKGYSFSTVKQTYNLLNEYFDYFSLTFVYTNDIILTFV